MWGLGLLGGRRLLRHLRFLRTTGGGWVQARGLRERNRERVSRDPPSIRIGGQGDPLPPSAVFSQNNFHKKRSFWVRKILGSSFRLIPCLREQGPAIVGVWLTLGRNRGLNLMPAGRVLEGILKNKRRRVGSRGFRPTGGFHPTITAGPGPLTLLRLPHPPPDNLPGTDSFPWGKETLESGVCQINEKNFPPIF